MLTLIISVVLIGMCIASTFILFCMRIAIYHLWSLSSPTYLGSRHRWIAGGVSTSCLYNVLNLYAFCIFVVCVDERVRLLFMAGVCILLCFEGLLTSFDCTTFTA